MSTDSVFLDYSVKKLMQLANRIGACLDQLTPEQVWLRGGQNDNAIGNLVLHLCGNVEQWIGSGVGGKTDTRQRDAEFAARANVTPAELKARLLASVADAAAVIEGVSEARLMETTRVQKYEITVLEAIYHVVEHFSGHTGQVIFATKLLTGADLGFYGHLTNPTHSEKTP